VERARYIGEKILQALNPLEIDWEGRRYSVNASIGIAMSGTAMQDEKAWLQAADKACYVAKRAGRGRLEFTT